MLEPKKSGRERGKRKESIGAKKTREEIKPRNVRAKKKEKGGRT